MQHSVIITPGDHITFTAATMSKATLFQSDRLLVGLNGFEPGQEHRLHSHAGMDKVYIVVSGRGVALIGERQEPIEAGQLLVAPEGVPHGIRNTGSERLLVVAILAPAPSARSQR